MLFLSKMLSNLRMKPISEIRLQNVERLVREAGTAEALAEKSGLSPVYLSQIRSRAIDVKTGKPRNLGSAAARKLEKGMSKPVNWMDADHNATPPDQDGWPFPRIEQSEFSALTQAQRDAIEDWVMAQVRAFSGAANPREDEPNVANG